MALIPGTRLGAYEVAAHIGEGGMGEVYRAHDSRLHRDVAIKVLPELFALDPDRLTRFEREAQVLASLNHPNIAHVYGVENEAGIHALVMELVEGDDLSQRITRGPIPLDEALPIARQIAEGLEAAHERGVIHRDLKPANIKVRADGTVKILDFGLAKALDPIAGREGLPASASEHSPTFTSPARTEMGMILGTAAYMAPEQARGRVVDRRADTWAFGCVVYEMLTGRRPFRGDDVSMTLAAILKESVDYSALPSDTPPALARLLRRCLEKDPRKRQSSMADARLDLEDVVSEPSVTAIPLAAATKGRWRGGQLLWALAGAAIAAGVFVIALGWRPPRDVDQRVVRSTITFNTPLRLSGNRAIALNPAGTEMVLVGHSDAVHYALYRRRLDSQDTALIAGTEQAEGPFVSPDGQWLAFTQDYRLKKMPAAGGGVVDLGEATGMQGGTFAADGSLIFNPQHGEGLQRIAAGGSERTALTTIDPKTDEAGHHWPHMLPDGKHLLFTVEIDGKPYSEAKIVLLSVESGERKLLIDGGTDARYLPTGHIVYWRAGALWRVPFDATARVVTGNAEPVLPDVMAGEPNGQAHIAVADNGTIAYVSGRDVQEEHGLMLVDRAGVARQLGDRRAFETVSVSRDGRRIAVTVLAANDSLWTSELDRLSFTRITYEAESAMPEWSPDGSRLVIARHFGGGSRRLYLMPSDGSAPPALLRESSRAEFPESWSPDGNLLIFTRQEATGRDIWVMDVLEREAKPLLATRFNETQPRFSPDGGWLAYVSDESGRPEVYVRPYPGPGAKRLVSSGGGTEPRWRGDGRELFYRAGDAVMSADIALVGGLRPSVPRRLFTGPFRADANWPSWDALPNGQGFLLIQDFAQPRTSVHLVQNWFKVQ